LGAEGKNIAWIEWSKMCQSKDKREVAIRDIRIFNESLLEKWKNNLSISKNNVKVQEETCRGAGRNISKLLRADELDREPNSLYHAYVHTYKRAFLHAPLHSSKYPNYL